MNTIFWARTDSNSANNPALNLTGDPARQIEFVASGTSGDLVFDYASGGVDPDTQVMIGGIAYDFVFQLSATLPTTKPNGSQQVPDQFEGSEVYIITVKDYPSPGQNTRLTFMPDETASAAQMNSFGNGAISIQNIDTTTPGAVCFATGTHILTSRGEIPVEDLKVGDLVVTVDNGAKPILWISTSRHSWPGAADKERPIMLGQNALGPGMPHRDLVVSPQHGVLLKTLDQAGQHQEVLAPSKGLTDLPGVRRMNGKRDVVYFHILLESHEILISEGLPSESFYPGPTALRMLGLKRRTQVLKLLPALQTDRENGYGPRARRSLSVSQAQKLARQMQALRPSPQTAKPIDIRARRVVAAVPMSRADYRAQTVAYAH